MPIPIDDILFHKDREVCRCRRIQGSGSDDWKFYYSIVENVNTTRAHNGKQKCSHPRRRLRLHKGNLGRYGFLLGFLSTKELANSVEDEVR